MAEASAMPSLKVRMAVMEAVTAERLAAERRFYEATRIADEKLEKAKSEALREALKVALDRADQHFTDLNHAEARSQAERSQFLQASEYRKSEEIHAAFRQEISTQINNLRTTALAAFGVLAGLITVAGFVIAIYQAFK
jgi:hypothetical protein